MAMRRRIKVAVNLTKRRGDKPKVETINGIQEQDVHQQIKVEVSSEETNDKLPQQADKDPKTTIPVVSTCNVVADSLPNDESAFKCPPKVEFNRSNSITVYNNDEVFQGEMDDGAQVMQMDLQRSASSFPMSPSKVQRQRIKPTPIFGQRRNSFVGPPPSSPVPDDTPEQPATPPTIKRERHFSNSNNFPPNSSHSLHKTTGRIRTESSCSVFSDSHLSTISKTRKIDEQNAHRQTRRDFEARFSNGVPDKSTLKMSDLIYYNPATNPMEQKPKIEEMKSESFEQETEETENKNGTKESSANPVPQLKLNAKGELILDDKSLEIETTAEQEARKVLAKSSLIFLDENTGMNGFYRRHKRTRDWPSDETIRFYRCLQTIGTDFSLMCQLFPNRTRRDLKLKFKKEERCNGALINKALLHPNLFNIQDLKDQFEIEDQQRREEENRAKISLEFKKVQIKNSKSARALKNADDVYNQELTEAKPKRKPKTRIKDEISESKAKRKKQPKNNTEETNISGKILDDPKSDEAQQTNLELNESPSQLSSFFKSTSEFITGSGPVEEENSNFESEHTINMNNKTLNTILPYHSDIPADENSRTFINLDSGNISVEDASNTIPVEPTTHCINNHTELTNVEDNNACSLSTFDITNKSIESQSEDIESTMDIDKPLQNDVPLTESKISTVKNETTSLASDADEKDIEIDQILENIINGSLVVVSSYDPNNPDVLVNQIFMQDQKTGELCNEPLDLPDEIVQGILSVMT